MKNRNQKQLVIIAILFIVIATGVAYAALQTNLNVTVNKITQSSLTWDVKFTAAGSAVAGGTSATGRSCGAASISSDSLTVTVADTTLSKPDDSCHYKLTIKNNGTIPAKLQTITATDPSGLTCTKSGASMVCGNITYALASAVTFNTTTNIITSQTVLTTGATLAAAGTRDIYLVARYTGSGVNSSAVTQSGAKFTILYNQA